MPVRAGKKQCARTSNTDAIRKTWMYPEKVIPRATPTVQMKAKIALKVSSIEVRWQHSDWSWCPSRLLQLCCLHNIEVLLACTIACA